MRFPEQIAFLKFAAIVFLYCITTTAEDDPSESAGTMRKLSSIGISFRSFLKGMLHEHTYSFFRSRRFRKTQICSSERRSGNLGRLLQYSEFNQWSARTEWGSSGPDPLLLEMVYEYKDVLRGV